MTRTAILTPIGRLVAGSLYEGQTKNADGTPKVVKNGPNTGQPRVEFYFGIAIPKIGPHWNTTPWGQIIWQAGQAGFPQGQANSPAFAWKITDGDSQIPNKAGKKPCDQEGYAGHWVLNFSGGFAPRVFSSDGAVELKEVGHVKAGYYIQVYGNVDSNGSTQSPGVYLNHDMVSFAAVGDVIVSRAGPDASTVGFGQSSLPAGAMPIPATPMQQAMAAVPVVPVVPVVPNPAFLSVPSPVPARVLTPKAQGASYDSLIAAGWTDDLLVKHGMMLG